MEKIDNDKKYMYVNINKSFVETGILDKQPDGTYREYNKVTLPENTVINEENVGGYAFYPLYVNESKINPNMVSIPLLKDRGILLNKNGQRIEVMPAEISEAVLIGYKDWKKEKMIETGRDVISAKEFDWQGEPIKKYIDNYINVELDRLQENGMTITVDPYEFADKLMENDMNKGMIFDGGDYEAKLFIREYFWEAVDTYEALEMNGLTINPFGDSEMFGAQMINRKISEVLEENEYLQNHKDESIKLTKDNVNKIKKSMGLLKEIEHDIFNDIELE